MFYDDVKRFRVRFSAPPTEEFGRTVDFSVGQRVLLRFRYVIRFPTVASSFPTTARPPTAIFTRHPREAPALDRGCTHRTVWTTVDEDSRSRRIGRDREGSEESCYSATVAPRRHRPVSPSCSRSSTAHHVRAVPLSVGLGANQRERNTKRKRRRLFFFPVRAPNSLGFFRP